MSHRRKMLLKVIILGDSGYVSPAPISLPPITTPPAHMILPKFPAQTSYLASTSSTHTHHAADPKF